MNQDVRTFSELDGLMACGGDGADDLCEGLQEQVLLLRSALKIGVTGAVEVRHTNLRHREG